VLLLGEDWRLFCFRDNPVGLRTTTEQASSSPTCHGSEVCEFCCSWRKWHATWHVCRRRSRTKA